MSGKTLWCSVTGSDGIQTKKTAEIHGEGKAYLRSLSQCLSVMQAEVNEVLTEQVEKARAAQGAGSAATTCTARGASDIEDMEEDSEEEASDGTCPSPKRKKS